MILGLISFSLFIIEDSSNSSSSFTVDHDWVLVFHFVHYLICFIGASFILQSITLCVSNSRLKEVVWKSRGASADTLRGQYDVLRTRWEGRIGKRLTAAFMWLTSPAERIAIRLFSHAFIKMYKLPRTFLFPMYLQLCVFSPLPWPKRVCPSPAPLSLPPAPTPSAPSTSTPSTASTSTSARGSL